MKRVQAKKEVKKTGKQKDMSVSELAGMVAQGFLETQTTLRSEIQDSEERLGRRIDGVEGRLNILDHKVDRLQDSVNEISYDSHKKTTRIENLELKVFGSIQEA